MDEAEYQPNNTGKSLLKSLYIFERDSKYVYEFEIQNKTLSKRTAITSSNFPHNFQTVLLSSGRLFFIGGGEFNSLNESMFKCYEVNTTNFEFIGRDRMKFPRHGHSACSLNEKFLVVTGSRKENDGAH